jgi:Tfp pilus assembly protein PilN
VSRQPDFSTTPRPRRAPVWDSVALAAGLAALLLSGVAAARAREEARAAGARLAEVRREVETATARLRAFDARAGGTLLQAAEASPARIVADLASVLPADVRLERLSIDYARGGALEIDVVARDAGAWDLLLERLDEAPRFGEVTPGPEAREAEVRSLVRARWIGGRP